MKVIVTGANGQLAHELIASKPAGVELIPVTREELDISDLEAVRAFFAKTLPDAVINAAAYTAVDKAEESQEQAYAVNEKGIENIAKASAQSCYVLHVSTDFVFDGKHHIPYKPSDKEAPISVYGKSKLAGEKALATHKKNQWAVVRTAWVYSCHGNNFVKSMLRFMAERTEMNIVVDQVGTPTWAAGLAQVLWAGLDEKIQGVFHWSDAGVASWYDFACAINELGNELDLLDRDVKLTPIATEQYPLPASRPAYSVLDKSEMLAALPNIQSVHWRKQLKLMMLELKNMREN